MFIPLQSYHLPIVRQPSNYIFSNKKESGLLYSKYQRLTAKLVSGYLIIFKPDGTGYPHDGKQQIKEDNKLFNTSSRMCKKTEHSATKLIPFSTGITHGTMRNFVQTVPIGTVIIKPR